MKNLSMVCVLCGDGREVVDEESSHVRESRRQGIYGLNSVRQDSKVVPDKGVYVEMEGIMKVSCTAVKTLTTRTSQNTFSPPRAR